MQSSQIPVKFPEIWGANADPSNINAIPTTTTTPGRASLDKGFPVANSTPIAAGGTPPFGPDFNGIFNQIVAWSQWQNAGGLTVYDATFSGQVGGYPKGAILSSATSGVVWLSTAENNTTNPDAAGAGWVKLAASGSSWAGVFGGSANALTATLLPAPTALAAGQVVEGIVLATNTSTTVTLTVGALAAKNVTREAASSLLVGDLVAAAVVRFVYDGTEFQLTTTPATSLATFTGDTGSGGKQGLVPAPSAGSAALGELLGAGGAFVLPKFGGAYRGLKVTVTGNTTAMIAAVGLTVFDGSGNVFPLVGVSLTNTNSGTGANGLDTGTIATSTWYNLFVIYNPTTGTVASLLSLSATAPTLPSGYTYFYRVGALRNAASGGYWRTIQYGAQATIAIGTNPTSPPTVASGGASYLTAAPVGSFVPPTALGINVILYTASGSNSNAAVAPNASYSTPAGTLYFNNGGNTPITIAESAMIVLESTNIYYGASSGALYCNGWVDNL